MKKQLEIVEKKWGHEKIIHNSDGYCGKILFFKKGHKCSFHFHKLKTETFYCVGKIIIRYGNTDKLEDAQELVLNTGDVFHVPVGLRHQMEAIEDSQLFEFSTPHFDEDSIRIISGE